MPEIFEFIDCPSINIAYQTNGLATVSFTVVSTSRDLGSISGRTYTELSFGGVDFKGWITQVDTVPIQSSIPTTWEHRLSLVMTGCASDCPRGSLRPS